MSRKEEVEWLDARTHEMYAIGVTLRLHGGDSIGWYCDAIIRSTVYCSMLGDTQREAMSKTIAAVVAGRLEGLQLGG